MGMHFTLQGIVLTVEESFCLSNIRSTHMIQYMQVGEIANPLLIGLLVHALLSTPHCLTGKGLVQIEYSHDSI